MVGRMVYSRKKSGFDTSIPCDTHTFGGPGNEESGGNYRETCGLPCGSDFPASQVST